MKGKFMFDRISRDVWLGLCGAVLGVMLVIPAFSSAADVRANCVRVQKSYSAGEWYRCAWDDRSDFRASSINTLNMHWYNAGTFSAQAKACVEFYNATGGECGTLASGSATGSLMLQPSRSKWSTGNLGHMKYLTSDNLLTIKGIFATTP